MPRTPSPSVGQLFDEDFAAVLATAIRLNPAVHDGAIMIGRADCYSPYIISGWSFRLFAGSAISLIEANRGSAFNSCIAMSTVTGVDGLYLISKAGIERCSRGKALRL
jgi:hypothetical protein